MIKNSLLFIFLILYLVFSSCSKSPDKELKTVKTFTQSEELPKISEVKERNNFPVWVKNANILEIDLYQFTPQGNLADFSNHLSKIKDQGIDILCLKSIFAIKKSSVFSIPDYKSINPDLGTIEDFKVLLSNAHNKGMHLILDWNLNLAGDDTGNDDLKVELISAMKFWINELKIDGFRFEDSGKAMNDFWEQTSEVLFEERPLLLISKNESASYNNSGSFLATHAKSFNNLMFDIVNGNQNANAIDAYLKKDRDLFKRGFHVYLTGNDKMEEKFKAVFVLATTFDGITLVSESQTDSVKKRFVSEKESINWWSSEQAEFTKILFQLKHRNQALWNGKYGGEFIRIPTGNDKNVYAFTREKNGDRIVVIVNLSKDIQEVKLSDDDWTGSYNNVFANSTISIEKDTELTLNGWDYLVLSNK